MQRETESEGETQTFMIDTDVEANVNKLNHIIVFNSGPNMIKVNLAISILANKLRFFKGLR